jgi:transcriptional regulator with XRE-family HTH domain
MNITICENLKKLRRDKGNTQEELAEHLNVSMQAVSKWERGECYPDITLLPAVALYYNVTIDKLLGMDEQVIEAKIKEYEAKELELSQTFKGGIDEHQKEQIVLWREAQKEFPNHHRVLMQLLTHLVYPVRNVSNYFDEVIQIGERLLAESTDNDIRFGTINLLCNTYAELKDFENAKKYADMVPSYGSSKEILYGFCLFGEESIKHNQQNISRFVTMIHQFFVQDISRKGGVSIEERIKSYEFSLKLYQLLYSDGDFGYWHLSIYHICFNIANFCAYLGRTDEALFYLNEMAEHLIKADEFYNMDGDYKHTSFMVNRLVSPGNNMAKDSVKRNIPQELQRISETQSFDSIRNDERYIAALEKIKSIADNEVK